MTSPALSGGCLCGQIRFVAEGEPAFTGFCYCRHCRRLSGAGRTPFLGFSGDALSVTGELSRFADDSDAGAGIERAFCPTCGARVMARPGSAPGFVIVYAGALDQPDAFKPSIAIHTAHQPPWEAPPEGLDSFEGDAPA